jgi:hypothetical protein
LDQEEITILKKLYPGRLKNFDRDAKIFYDVLNGESETLISQKNNISTARVNQIYRKFIYRIGYKEIRRLKNHYENELIERMHSVTVAADCMYDQVNDMKKGLGDIHQFYAKVNMCDGIIKEFKTKMVVILDVFNVFDLKLNEINDRLNKLEEITKSREN